MLQSFLQVDDPAQLRVQCEALVDMVRRLSAEVDRYHRRYGALSEAERTMLSAPGKETVGAASMGASWLGQVGRLPPLLRAYDDRLQDQSSRLSQYEQDLAHLQERTAAVLAENEALTQQNGDLLAAEVSQEDWDDLRQGMALLVQENKLLIQTAEEAQMAGDARKRTLEQETRYGPL